MKKRSLLSFLVCVVVAIGIQAQHNVWREFTGSTTASTTALLPAEGVDFNGIDFFPPSSGSIYGYIVGELESGKGFVAKTTDGGFSWVKTSMDSTALPNVNSGTKETRLPFKGLTGIKMINATYIYAWGKEGTMLRTGTTKSYWHHLTLPEGTGDCQSAAFNTTGTICVVTDGDRIYHTSDGGVSWITCELPEGVTGIREMIYVKDNCFMAVAANNVILTSSSSGYSWEKINYIPDGTADYTSIITKAGTTAGLMDVLIGGTNTSGKPVIFKAELAVENSIASIRDLYQTNSLNEDAHIRNFVPSTREIYAVCSNGKIYRSPDDGLNWAAENISFEGKENRSLCITGQEVMYMSGTNGLTAIRTPELKGEITFVKKEEDTYRFSLSYTGFARNFLWVFPNSGQANSSLVEVARDVVFNQTGENTVTLTIRGQAPGMAKPDTLILQKTVSSIKQGDWDLIITVDTATIYNSGICFPEGQNLVGYMSSSTSTTSGQGYISKTEDGGNTWRCILQTPEDKSFIVHALHSICFTSMNVGYASGYGEVKKDENGTVTGKYPQIWKTEDGGENWRMINMDRHAPDLKQDYFFSITFFDENNGVVHNQSSVYYTTDAGETWERSAVTNTEFEDRVHLLSFRHLCYLDQSTLIGVGKDAQIYRSEDAGRSWFIVSSEYLSGKTYMHVAFRNDKHGYILPDDLTEGKFLETEDGGLTWKMVDPGKSILYHCMTFVNDSVYYAGGSHAAIIKTEDSGHTWSVEKHTTKGESPTALVSSATGVVFASGAASTVKRLIPKMNADFSYEVGDGLSVSFKNKSVGFITDFKWEVNGVEQSTEMSPTLTFEGNQTYEVKLTVSGVDPRDSVLYTEEVVKTIELLSTSLPGLESKDGYLEIYPNPVVDQLNLKVNLAKASDVRVLVTGVTGQEIESASYPQTAAGETIFSLSASSWDKGIYFVTLSVDGKVARTVKVIR